MRPGTHRPAGIRARKSHSTTHVDCLFEFCGWAGYCASPFGQARIFQLLPIRKILERLQLERDQELYCRDKGVGRSPRLRPGARSGVKCDQPSACAKARGLGIVHLVGVKQSFSRSVPQRHEIRRRRMNFVLFIWPKLVLLDRPKPERFTKVDVQIRFLTYCVALTIMLGWLIWVGKPVLLPIIAALISVYVLSTAATSMERLPILGRLPGWVRRTIVLVAFAAAVVLLFLLVINNLAQVSAALIRYEANLDALATRFASLAGIEDEPTWENLRRVTFDQIDFGAWVAPALA